jgi:hypothetical protein
MGARWPDCYFLAAPADPMVPTTSPDFWRRPVRPRNTNLLAGHFGCHALRPGWPVVFFGVQNDLENRIYCGPLFLLGATGHQDVVISARDGRFSLSESGFRSQRQSVGLYPVIGTLEGQWPVAQTSVEEFLRPDVQTDHPQMHCKMQRLMSKTQDL